VRKKVGEFYLFGFGYTDLLQRQLRPIAVNLNAPLHLHKIVARKLLRQRFKLVPHPRFDGSGAVAEFQSQISFPRRGVANFLLLHQKKSGDALFNG
jgi:hypothetical protein